MGLATGDAALHQRKFVTAIRLINSVAWQSPAAR